MDFREGVPKEERNPLRVVRVYRKLCKPAECSDKKKTIKKKKRKRMPKMEIVVFANM